MAKKVEPQIHLPRHRKTFSELPARDIASSRFVKADEHPDDIDPRLGPEEVARELAAMEAATFVMEIPKADMLYHDGLSSGNSGSNLAQLLSNAQPKERRRATFKAYKHYEEDDLLGGLIDCLIEFTSLGLGMQVTSPVVSQADPEQILEIEEQIDNLALDMDLDKIVEDLLRDRFVTDNMILYWRTLPEGEEMAAESGVEDCCAGIPNVYDISALHPGVVDWNNSLGQDVLICDIPALLVSRIQKALDRIHTTVGVTIETVIHELGEEGIGQKWVEAVHARQTKVVLREEDGDHWIIKTRERKYHGLARPSMYRIFLPLESRRILTEGDYSTSLMMKNFLMLLKQGESIESGPNSGKTTNWMKKKEAIELNNRFASVARSMRIAVNHTFKIEYSFPPKEMFDETKYTKIEKRIFSWAGVTQTFYGGGGSEDTYGSGFIGIKRMVSKMTKVRGEVNRLWREFFRHPSVAPNLKLPEKHGVELTFDDNCLKEPKQILDEVKFLFENAISDQRTSARELGRNPDSAKVSKLRSRREDENDQSWSPVGMQGQKKSVDKGGRPANDGTTQNENTRSQPPSGS